MKIQSYSKYSILVILLLLLSCNKAVSQTYFIKNYSIESGLPTNFIFDVTQDTKGRMWFATSVGVSIYDGLQWGNLDSADGLPKTIYKKILTDEKGIIWCLPSNMCGTIVYFINDTLKKITLPENRNDAKDLNITSFEIVYENEEPVLCIGTIHGLYFHKKNNWKKYTVSDGLLDEFIYSISVHKGKFYVSTKGGISVFSGNKFDNSINELFPSNLSEVIAIKFEGNPGNSEYKTWVLGKNWIGYIENNKFSILNDRFLLPTGVDFIYPSLVICKNNLIFFGNYYYSYYINKISGDLFPATHIQGFCSDGSTSIFLDKEENIWMAGTRGIDKVNNLYLVNYNSSYGLKDNEVTAINEYEPGKFIIGHNNGYSLFSNNKITKIDFLIDKYGYLGNNRVMDIYKDDNGILWLACAANGLGRLDANGNLKWIKIENNYVNSVSKDKKGNICVTTNYGIYIVKNDRFERSAEYNLNEHYYRRIYFASDDEVYFTSSSGLVRKIEKEYKTLTTNIDEQANNVYAVYKDKNNRVFVGTKAGLYTLKNDNYEKFLENGFTINKSIYAIIQDKSGNYWFGTEDGVVKWDGKGKEKVISKRNGLSGIEINRGALFEDSKGDIWIGTESGMTCYRPEYDNYSIPVPNVLLYSTEDDEGIVYPLTKNISLSSNIRSLYFNFRGISYYNENNIKYKIKLEGFDADWYEINQSQIDKTRYTNLKPRDYKLLVSAKNISGEWSKVVESSVITIEKPYYQKWWFFIIILIAIYVLLHLIYKLYIGRMYHLKLENQVQERTSKLSETEKALRKSQTELEEKVIERTSELAVANVQLKELNTSKDKFFSIIAHDMKSPFTGLLGYSELLKNEAMAMEKEKVIEYSDNLYKNLKSTYNLLENLLNWASLQTGRMSFNPEEVDLFLILQGIIGILKVNADAKGIDLKNNVHSNTTLRGDKNMLWSVLYNLISNGIKFTNRKGYVIISSKKTDKHIEISVSDNGVGIPKESLNMLFKLDSNITTKGTEMEKGTGLGLLLCKEMIEKHKGIISVESEEGKGTTFKIILPLS